MAEKNNAKCSICDKDYYLCMSCKDTLSLHPWRVHTCSASHYQVYQIIRGYNTKVYTKDEAKAKLKNVDLSDMSSFRPHIKQIVKDILKEKKPVVQIVEEVVEPVVLVQPAETDAVATEENIAVEKMVASRKRNYRAEVE